MRGRCESPPPGQEAEHGVPLMERKQLSSSSNAFAQGTNSPAHAIVSTVGSSPPHTSQPLEDFCKEYFGANAFLSKALKEPSSSGTVTSKRTKSKSSHCCKSSMTLDFIRFLWELILSLVTRTGTKYSRGHIKLQYAFAACTCIGVGALIVSIAAALVGTKAHYCDVVVPTDDGNCCVCVCDVNQTWCAKDRPYEVPVAGVSNLTSYDVSVHGNFFAGSNDVVSLTDVRTIIMALTSSLSILGIVFQLMLGIHRGNFYMLVGLIMGMMLQVARSIYSHYTDSLMYGSNYLKGNGEWTRVICDALAAAMCLCLIALVSSLRPGFRTLQFQQFGALTTHQVTLRYYNIMFATVLLDAQASVCFYSMMFSMAATSDPWGGNVLQVLNAADLFVQYLAYQYIRFEKRFETWLALGTKIFLSLSWLTLLYHYFTCFCVLKSKSVFLRYQLKESLYLGVDAHEASRYLVDTCPISPVIAGASDLMVLFAVTFVALLIRGTSVFYMVLLSFDFGSGVVSSLFFDVVSAKQREGTSIAVSKQLDTIDMTRSEQP